jgi:hypothetical protein
MKPAYDKLGEEYKDSSSVVIGVRVRVAVRVRVRVAVRVSQEGCGVSPYPSGSSTPKLRAPRLSSAAPPRYPQLWF